MSVAVNSSLDPAAIIMSLSILIAGLIVLAGLLRGRGLPVSVVLCAVTGLIGHIVVGGALYLFGVAEVSDAQQYNSLAIELVDYWKGLAPEPRLIEGKAGWTYLLAGLYYVAGPNLVYGVVINAVVMACIPMVLYRIGTALGQPRLGVVSAWMSLAVPGYWFWGSLPLRESITLLAITVTALAAAHLSRGTARVPWAFVMIAALLVLLAFRGSMAFLVAFAIVLGLSTSLVLRSGQSRGRWVIVPLVIVVGVLGQSALASANSTLSVERINAVRGSQSTGTSTGFAVDETASGTAGDLGSSLVITLPRVVLGPFPWELSGSGSILLLDALLWWLSLYLMIVGLRTKEGRLLALLLVPTIVGLFVALALYSGNYGTMIRLRSQAYPFVLPIAAAGFIRILDRARARRKSPMGRVSHSARRRQ